MRALEVFRQRHQFAYDIFYADLPQDWTEDQLRTSAHPTMNSLIWTLWHVARVEDAGVARFVMRQSQVLHHSDWNGKMGIQATHFGFGGSREEMLHISQTINLGALLEYWGSVRGATYDVLNRVSPNQLDEVLSEEEVREVLFTEGVGLPNIEPVVETYTGWTRLEALYHFSATHYYWHGGEVRTIEGMLRGS